MEAGKATGDIKHLSDQHLGGRGLFLELNLQFSNLQKRIALRKMSLEFEYRRLAGAYLDLAKRAVVLGDKKRLLLIAEAPKRG